MRIAGDTVHSHMETSWIRKRLDIVMCPRVPVHLKMGRNGCEFGERMVRPASVSMHWTGEVASGILCIPCAPSLSIPSVLDGVMDLSPEGLTCTKAAAGDGSSGDLEQREGRFRTTDGMVLMVMSLQVRDVR